MNKNEFFSSKGRTGKIEKISNLFVPKNFRDMGGVGIYRLDGKNKIVLGRSLLGTENEIKSNVERILVPFKKTNGLWDVRVDMGILNGSKLDDALDYNDFPYLYGFSNFPLYNQISFHYSPEVLMSTIEHSEDKEIIYNLYSQNGRGETMLTVKNERIEYGTPLVFRIQYFSHNGRYESIKK